jgi:hypothetical protein
METSYFVSISILFPTTCGSVLYLIPILCLALSIIRDRSYIWYKRRFGVGCTFVVSWFASFFFQWFYSLLGPWPLIFSFMIIFQTVGLLGRVMSSSKDLYLNTGQHKHRINTYRYRTSMRCVGFESTIPASERAKTVHALGRLATMTGSFHYT